MGADAHMGKDESVQCICLSRLDMVITKKGPKDGSGSPNNVQATACLTLAFPHLACHW